MVMFGPRKKRYTLSDLYDADIRTRDKLCKKLAA